MFRAPSVIAGCVVLALLTATCRRPSSHAAPGPRPAVVAPPPAVTLHDASTSATEVVAVPPPAPPADVAAPPAATSRCEPLPIDPTNGQPRSSPRVYAAALRYFLAHTAPGSRHALGPDLARERRTFRFGNTNERETGAVMQATVDEIVTRYPDSLVVPTTRPLRTDACYDEVYLDLTEDGRYVVIVETATARPVFMYWQHYRP